MGLAAFIVSCSGDYVVLGLSSVSVQSAEITQIQMVVTQFLKKIRRHDWLRGGDAFEPLVMPWVKENFQTCITPGVGVWKTHTTTLAMVSLRPSRALSRNRET